MSESDLQTQIAAAKAYEEFFVPALSGEWAPRVAHLTGIRTGEHVLDVACGTGVLAREAASQAGPSGFVAGVDVSPGMLAVAKTVAPRIEWRAAKVEALPYPDHRFDTDRRRALSEMHRVLKRSGRLAIAVWASLESAAAYAAEVALLERMAGKAAADALRAPFVLGDPTELKELVAGAGVDKVTVTTQRRLARFPNIRFMVEADLRGWLSLMGIVLAEEQISRILQDAEGVLGAYVTATGTIACEIAAHLDTGTRS